ncbi:MAG TPA: hypothetical protein VH333_12245, partial [Pseudonocardiaceae bacterium]|nr:hypothetical protein [Pseudonocardiaceae bacterium]
MTPANTAVPGCRVNTRNEADTTAAPQPVPLPLRIGEHVSDPGGAVGAVTKIVIDGARVGTLHEPPNRLVVAIAIAV